MRDLFLLLSCTRVGVPNQLLNTIVLAKEQLFFILEMMSLIQQQQ
jgi:hypothetical protein